MKGFFWLTILCASIAYGQDNCNTGNLLNYAGYANNYSFNNVAVQTNISCLTIKYVAAGSNTAAFKQFVDNARLSSTGTDNTDYKHGSYVFSKPVKNFSVSFDAISQDERIIVKAYRAGNLVNFSQRNSDIYTNGYHTNSSVKVLTLAYTNFVDSFRIELTGLSGPNYTAYANVTFSNGCVNCLAVLPIELSEFKATIKNDRAIELDWSTNVEFNNDRFVVERSVDGISWTTLSTIQGAGNSTQPLHYEWTDINPISGTNYYRLKQVDFNGNFTYSFITRVNTLNNDSEGLLVFPNPVNNTFTIEASNLEPASLQLLDILGNNCMDQINIISETSQRMLMDASELKSGIYFVVNGNNILKLIKN